MVHVKWLMLRFAHHEQHLHVWFSLLSYNKSLGVEKHQSAFYHSLVQDANLGSIWIQMSDSLGILPPILLVSMVDS